MQENDLTSQSIGLALQKSGLHPYDKGINRYGVYRGGDDYEVLTERLPEIYIWKIVPQDLFDWRDDKQVLDSAANLFNANPFPVRAVIGYDTIRFVLNTELVSGEQFSARILSWMDQIEEALDLFGQSCAMVVRDYDKDDLYWVAEQLSNPDYDSPWLKGEKASWPLCRIIPKNYTKHT